MLKTIGQYAILLILIAAIIIIVVIGCAAMGVVIPMWVQQVFWVLVIAFVIIGAIKLLVSWPPATP